MFRAENVDLDDKKIPAFKESVRTKQVQINEDIETFSTASPAVEIDRDLLRDLEAEIMTMLSREEGRRVQQEEKDTEEEEEAEEDYLDFDTDLITITMETDLSDLTRPWRPPVGRLRQRRPLPLFRRSPYPREVYYRYQ